MPVAALTTPLLSLSWGGKSVTDPNNITVYFANAGEKFSDYTSEGFNAYEKAQFMAALNTISAVANVNFSVVTTSTNATFKMVLDNNEFNDNDTDGQMGPPEENNAGVGEFNELAGVYTAGGTLERGARTYSVLIHEFLHAMGLAHPHDDGGGSTIMAGVTGSDVLGDFNLNQGVYTVMTYNDGYKTGLAGSAISADGLYGSMMGPAALDIAVLQFLYGANTTTNSGDNVYLMPDTNATGIGFLTLWDTGGQDEIRYNGAGNATIDLRPATLLQESGGGGWVSSAAGIAGGFTIANGVVIEKATGGSGNDLITGNDAANMLYGGTGADTIYGGLGADILEDGNGNDMLYGGGGKDTWVMNSGRDTFDGGSGSDTVIVDSANFSFAAGTVFETNLATGDSGAVGNPNLRDTLISVENYTFIGSNAFKMTGNADINALTSGSGNDTLIGASGHDVLMGNGGSDFLYGDALGLTSISVQANQVFRLYHATLGRDPDVSGHLGWASRLLEGQSNLSQVSAGFVGSTEFQNTYGSLNTNGFVNLLYQNVLGRAADAGGLAAWSARLDSGTSRADVVLGFSESAEYKQSTNVNANASAAAHTPAAWADDVFRLYHATLDRDPDLAGFTAWTDTLGTGVRSLTQAAVGFVGSTEFSNTYGFLNSTAFVELLYQNVLGRAADANGLAGWVSRLDTGGGGRADVVLGFSQSQEFTTATNPLLKTWIRAQGVDDVLHGGAGDNVLSGGRFADTFVFNAADDGSHRVLDIEAWDRVQFDGFGYTTTSDALGHLTQSGADVAFMDQGVSITFANTLLGTIVSDMILV